MRHFIAGLVLTGCMLPMAAGAMKLATEFTKVTAPHEFTHLDSDPLWSSDVKRVDVASQTFERIPGEVMPENLVAQNEGQSKGVLGSDMGKDESLSSADAEARNDDMKVAAQAWCSNRYRSYDAQTNSYQPYDGGTRKPCIAPAEISPRANQVVASASVEHLTWCSNRYNSYDASDNSYQPFSGARRQCISPEMKSVTADAARGTADLRASIN